MAENKTSILLSDVSIEGDLVEKDKIILDAKVSGDIKAEEIITHSKSNILGNIKSKIASLGGKLKGNINSDQIKQIKNNFDNIVQENFKKEKTFNVSKINSSNIAPNLNILVFIYWRNIYFSLLVGTAVLTSNEK